MSTLADGPAPAGVPGGRAGFPERGLLLLLAAVQFTHVLDFMVMMPLGPQLMRELGMTPGRFSALVSAYTVAAGVVGLLAAPFIDRHDRRTLLLGTYLGFIAGTAACAMARSGEGLLAARVLCGAFGGVSGALVLATVGDLVPPERRGAGLGLVMTSFSVASALGVPLGLSLAQRLRWEAPFVFIALLSVVTWILLWRHLPAVRGHLDDGGAGGWGPFLGLVRDANALRGLLFMASLVFGHFMVIPLMSPFFVGNVGLPEGRLFLVYLVGGLASVVPSARVGRMGDRHRR
ncbi:MAG: MFS transporter, partial [Verrucomicrobiota bacterium]